MPVLAIDEFRGYGIGAVLLVCDAAGVAEPRFASERDVFEAVAVFAVTESVAFGKVAAFQGFLDFGKNHGTDVRMRKAKVIPMILEYLFDCELCAHMRSPNIFYRRML
jgi:uncharacterized membrane protein